MDSNARWILGSALGIVFAIFNAAVGIGALIVSQHAVLNDRIADTQEGIKNQGERTEDDLEEIRDRLLIVERNFNTMGPDPAGILGRALVVGDLLPRSDDLVPDSDLRTSDVASETVPENASVPVTREPSAAEPSDADAQYALGMRYLDRRDYTAAVEWLHRAADQHQSDAQHYLSMVYYNGWGVETDYAAAVEWMRRAADQNRPTSQNSLGVFYARGLAVAQDFAEAAKWYRLAANQGDADGQYNLGVLYAVGKGVPEDFEEAVKWLRLAGEQDHWLAQHDLAWMYMGGDGVERDESQAASWMLRAANLGYVNAQRYVGSTMYLYGLGVPKDKIEAYKWLILAGAQGDWTAENQRRDLAGQMSDEQINRAQHAAREWTAREVR